MSIYTNRYLRMWLVVVTAAIFILGAAALTAAEEEKQDKPEKNKIHVEDWLVLGPFESPLPAFNDENDDTKMGAGELLGFRHIDCRGLWPVAGQKVSLVDGGTAAWTGVTAPDTAGALIPAGEKTPLVSYLCAFVDAPRWMKVKVEARGTRPFEVFVGGESVAKCKKDGTMAAGDKKSGDATLEKGKHLVLVKTVYVPGDSLVEWRFDMNVSAGDDCDVDPVVTSLPGRTMNISDVLDGPSLSGISVSPDGKLFKMSVSKLTPPEGDREGWVEIRRAADGKLVKTIRDLSGVGGWQWAPSGNRLAYTVAKDKKTALRVLDLDTGNIENVLEGIEDFGGYDWSPDGTFVVYSINVEPEEDKSGVKRMLGTGDRRHYERNKSFLYIASVPAGTSRKLSSGKHNTWVYDIHPDAGSALIGRSYEDMSERPYDKTELMLLDLESQTAELLYKSLWIRTARWSPDGKKILITGGPSMFDGAGRNLPEGVIPNDYDTQVYIYDPETKEVDAITKNFSPAVESVYWPKSDGYIYIVAEETEFNTLYRYDIKKQSYKKIELECDVVHSRSAADDEPVAVMVGSGADQPWRLYSVDMKKGKVRTIFEPVRERFEHVKIGKIDDWNFTTADGTTIVGRIHYPPNFDASKKWPCIVYYYGGTSPVTRSFGGRYPKNLWAAAGYVVWVLQPSGATGFGQEFSTRHVNDWGKTTAGEVIDGTKKFLAAHTFVDPERVGCIGASYGGFMTQLLITKTDIFAAAVSHAGISDITSYWGEGYWGYQYNAVSAAESFPWNRPDIYIDQSPLFAADKITTPLLLLHGAADTNVPRGESDQMYAALKILGKDVEYIRFAEQDHFIIEYKKRIAWSNAILGWFDKWLKEQPEWWDDMYPPVDGKDKTGEEE